VAKLGVHQFLAAIPRAARLMMPISTNEVARITGGTSAVDVRLRAIDASVMPDLIGGNINAAVIMIAEKASDLLENTTCPGEGSLTGIETIGKSGMFKEAFARRRCLVPAPVYYEWRASGCGGAARRRPVR
jgi:hypothetical protein